MIVELIGIYHGNKGALLMLEAIRERLSADFPDARFAVPITMPIEYRLRYGLYGTIAHDSYPIDLAGYAGLLPRKFRTKFGLIRPSEVDVVLDASGFGYGDYWGLRKLQRRLVRPLEIWNRAGKTAVLLPQALGPFSKDGMADAFSRAYDATDLIFARDRQSLKYAQATLDDTSKLKLAPDFTNLMAPAIPERLRGFTGASIVIPNEKLVVGASAAVRERYLAFLRKAIERLRASGRRAVMLVHEGDGDRHIAGAVNASLNEKAQIIDEASPLDLKAVIGAADVVVSSRFHGLVSALSAGVPVMACGWSHKYHELLGDYGCAEFSLNLKEDGPRLDSIFDEFLDRAAQPRFREELGERARIEKDKSELMWDQVAGAIRAKAVND
jgi:colanic acid/amylovoran biosynthesis protein